MKTLANPLTFVLKARINSSMRSILVITLLFFSCTHMQGQVFPGDADRNGQVNHEDILYIGYAYGTVGPARVEPGIETMEAPLALQWAEAFPNGENFAFADANGDGTVGINDMLAVFTNYGQENPPVILPDYLIGVSGLAPKLEWGLPNNATPITENSVVEIPIRMGTEASPIENINGLAFSIERDLDYVERINLQFEEGWLGSAEKVFQFQNTKPQNTELLNVALTRYGQDPATGKGVIGTVSIIIEDDLITFMEKDSAEVELEIRDIMLLDSNLQMRAVVPDTLSFTVYHPDAIVNAKEPVAPETFQLFPNPVHNKQVTLRWARPMQEARLYDMQGRVLARWPLHGRKEAALRLKKSLPPAFYQLQVVSEGQHTREQLLFIQ